MNVFEELSEASRRELLADLLDGPKNVSELVASSGLKQPNVSNHLARLRSRGFVRASKIGRQVYYSIGSQDVEEAVRSFLNAQPKEVETIDLGDFAREYAKHAVKGNELACQELVERSIRSNYGIIDIFQDFLGSAMTLVGTWYKVEAIDEAQEHMASEITQRMISRTAQYFGPRNRTEMKAVLGCAAHNWHIIGLRMLGDYLRFSGWETLYLGPNVPEESFVRVVQEAQPDLVLLSCAADEGIPNSLGLLEKLNKLGGTPSRFMIGVGGPAIRTHPEQFVNAGANFTANDLRTFAELSLPEIERVNRNGQIWTLENIKALQQISSV